jgi:ABC-type transport system involved in multi-copper enzyme maturation permease subunit
MQFKRLVANYGLPLLAKELTEQAARKRTYVIRVAYAIILFLMASLFFYQILQFAVSSPLAVLGHGKDMFATLVSLQFAGIYFFMPAMTCGLITQEKERASLQLLFLTRLGPWTILFEKLLGRLVPMAGFVLLSLPLLGFAYTLGGVSRDMLWKGGWMLFLAAIQMGTLALACSAFFRTTVGAFIASYVIAFLMFFGPYFCLMIVYLVGWSLNLDFESVLREWAPNIWPGAFLLVMFPFFTPPYFFGETMFPGGMGFWIEVGHSVVIVSVSGACLVLARRFLVDRAFLSPQNPILSLFRAFDRRRVRREHPLSARQMPAGPAVAPVATSDELLPGEEPIAWRETTKRILGHGRYTWRVVVIAEVALIMFCGLIVVANESASGMEIASGLLAGTMRLLMWVLAVLVVSVKSASLVASERTQQTLDVLCTSPLTGREILLQKFRGVRRLILALWLPFLTISLFVPWWAVQSAHRYQYMNNEFSPVLYLACSLLSVGTYFPLVAWLSFLIGLRVRTQIRAIIGSMAAIAGWCMAPLVFIVLPLAILSETTRQLFGATDWKVAIQLASLLSPATMVALNEADGLLEYPGPWLSVLINFAVYGAALVAFRAICLKNADRWLGRAEGKTEHGA